MQTKTQSFMEAMVNVAIGYFVALIGQFIIYSILKIPVTLSENLLISIWFSVLSIIRNYAVRRWFNAKIKRAIYG